MSIIIGISIIVLIIVLTISGIYYIHNFEPRVTKITKCLGYIYVVQVGHDEYLNNRGLSDELNWSKKFENEEDANKFLDLYLNNTTRLILFKDRNSYGITTTTDLSGPYYDKDEILDAFNRIKKLILDSKELYSDGIKFSDNMTLEVNTNFDSYLIVNTRFYEYLNPYLHPYKIDKSEVERLLDKLEIRILKYFS